MATCLLIYIFSRLLDIDNVISLGRIQMLNEGGCSTCPSILTFVGRILDVFIFAKPVDFFII